MPGNELARTFKVVFELELDDKQGPGWSVSIPAVQGCHSQGRSLAEARRNIREALSLFEEDFDGKAEAVAANAIFEEELRLPSDARAAVRRWERARATTTKVNEAAAQAREEEAAAARALTEMLSLRDAGELLGMSQEGVRKLIKGGPGVRKTQLEEDGAPRRIPAPAGRAGRP